MAAASLLVLLLLALTGCGSDLLRRVTGGPGIDDVPDFTFETADGDVAVPPWTWCYGNGCADGGPSERPRVLAGDSLVFSWPEDGWEFQATFREPGARCPRSLTVPVADLGDHRYRITPAGPAGRWHVDVFGNGSSGDAITTVEWTTTSEGPVQEPVGTVSVLTEHDGELDSYGVELSVDHLAATPRTASARVVVTAASGRSVTLEPQRARGCQAAGSLWFSSPDRVGRRALALGDGPFGYRVELTLDGRTYVGTGSWPDDEIADMAPATALTWEPALPAYTP